MRMRQPRSCTGNPRGQQTYVCGANTLGGFFLTRFEVVIPIFTCAPGFLGKPDFCRAVFQASKAACVPLAPPVPASRFALAPDAEPVARDADLVGIAHPT